MSNGGWKLVQKSHSYPSILVCWCRASAVFSHGSRAHKHARYPIFVVFLMGPFWVKNRRRRRGKKCPRCKKKFFSEWAPWMYKNKRGNGGSTTLGSPINMNRNMKKKRKEMIGILFLLNTLSRGMGQLARRLWLASKHVFSIITMRRPQNDGHHECKQKTK